MKEKIQLSKANTVTILEEVGKGFYLGFDLFIEKHTPGDYRSIIHLTVGNNAGKHGDRTPGIWLTADNELYFASSINVHPNSVYQSNIPLNEKVWYRVEFEQVFVDNGQGEVGKSLLHFPLLSFSFSILSASG